MKTIFNSTNWTNQAMFIGGMIAITVMALTVITAIGSLILG